jgi:hypothetical protein
MALTGQLSDLSLAELIEFFCNQRKTGRLKVIYPQAPGYFYIQAGSLVDAKIGDLSGIEAVYYALSLPNASFKFSPVFEASRRTIHQPWTQVVLEGLRRIDEGITQPKVFNEVNGGQDEDESELDEITESEVDGLEAFKAGGPTSAPLPMMVHNAADNGRSKGLLVAAAVVALAASVAVIGVPAGWYKKAAPVSTPTVAAQSTSAPASEEASNNSSSEAQAEETKPNDASANGAAAAATLNNDAILAAKREREARDRERMLRAAEERASASNAKQPDNTSTQAQAATANVNAAKKPDAPRTGPKMVSVQVTYDEAGRVTQASGGDATALRIARQKRFPAGKSGSTTVTIPIN